MKVKDDSINIWGLQPQMQPVLYWAEKVWEEHGQELVITSARDGMHSAGSLHYYGLAVDLRTRYFEEPEAILVAEELGGKLPVSFDVIRHKTHIHVEHQGSIDKVMRELV